MKDLIKMMTGAVLAATTMAFAGLSVSAQDPTKVDAKHYKVDFENDRVRVLRINYGTKERSVMHQHPDAVVIALTDMRTKFNFADGKAEERSLKAGETLWTPAGTHLPENVGAAPMQVILVELKDGSGVGTMPAAADDPAKVAAKHHKLEFENDRVRVFRSRIGPHEKTGMHAHPDNVVVFLTNSRVTSTMAEGKSEVAEGKAQQVIWRPALKHDAENMNDQPLEVIVVELKSK